MSRVIAIISGKGGTGKSTATANIGASLALKGKKTAVVDMDIGLRNLDMHLQAEDRAAYDILDVAEGVCALPQALLSVRENLDFLPAAQMRDSAALSAEKAGELLRSLGEEYEFVLIDSPAGLGHGFRSAVKAADEAILVLLPDDAALRDGERAAGLTSRIGLPPPLLLINRYLPWTDADSRLSAEKIRERFQAPLLGIVPEYGDMQRLYDEGKLLIDTQSEASQAYQDIAGRLLGQEIPYPPYKQPSFWEDLRQFLQNRRNKRKQMTR